VTPFPASGILVTDGVVWPDIPGAPRPPGIESVAPGAAGEPSGAAPGGCAASESVVCPGQDCGIVRSRAGSGGGRTSVPVIPAPAAPLPPPITTHETLGAGTTLGSGAAPATGAAPDTGAG